MTAKGKNVKLQTLAAEVFTLLSIDIAPLGD